MDSILERKYGSPDGSSAFLPRIETSVSTRLEADPACESVEDDLNKCVEDDIIKYSPTNKSKKPVKVYPERFSSDLDEPKYYIFSCLSRYFNVEPLVVAL
jgi:hypothetical protein